MVTIEKDGVVLSFRCTRPNIRQLIKNALQGLLVKSVVLMSLLNTDLTAAQLV
jgi:hypothetical protein